MMRTLCSSSIMAVLIMVSVAGLPLCAHADEGDRCSNNLVIKRNADSTEFTLTNPNMHRTLYDYKPNLKKQKTEKWMREYNVDPKYKQTMEDRSGNNPRENCGDYVARMLFGRELGGELYNISASTLYEIVKEFGHCPLKAGESPEPGDIVFYRGTNHVAYVATKRSYMQQGRSGYIGKEIAEIWGKDNQGPYLKYDQGTEAFMSYKLLEYWGEPVICRFDKPYRFTVSKATPEDNCTRGADPDITCPSNLSVSCDGQKNKDVARDKTNIEAQLKVHKVPEWMWLTPPRVQVSSDDADDNGGGTKGHPKTITRTFTAQTYSPPTVTTPTVKTCVQTITVENKTQPVITGTVPNPLFLECVAKSKTKGAEHAALLKGKDTCGGDALPATFDDGTATGSGCKDDAMTFTVKDHYDNEKKIDQAVTIKDRIAPTIDGRAPA